MVSNVNNKQSAAPAKSSAPAKAEDNGIRSYFKQMMTAAAKGLASSGKMQISVAATGGKYSQKG